MLIHIYPDHTDYHTIQEVVRQIESGAVLIYPTNHGYALGCSALKARAVERVCSIKGGDYRKHALTILCQDLSVVSTYARISNEAFALIKSGVHEPATYILPTTERRLTAPFKYRREIGVRLCQEPVMRLLLEYLETPLLTEALPELEKMSDIAYHCHPELIEEMYGHQVDFVIDGGVLMYGQGAIVDCRGAVPELIRPASFSTAY